MSDKLIKPNHKAIAAYYEALHRSARQEVTYESALRVAFLNLLSETAKTHNWDVIAELPYRSMKLKGRYLQPDATVRDEWRFDRGYWVAKDTADNLETEIRKKIQAGYPTSNIIFEDTIRGILFQNGQRIFETRLDDRQGLADILNQFYGYSQPTDRQLRGCRRRVQGPCPGPGEGTSESNPFGPRGRQRGVRRGIRPVLRHLPEDAQPEHPPGGRRGDARAAPADRTPLRQHLPEPGIHAPERRSPSRSRRVINALVSHSFNRQEFLQSLDRFYIAIEDAAQQKDDFTEKQRFLNRSTSGSSRATR